MCELSWFYEPVLFYATNLSIHARVANFSPAFLRLSVCCELFLWGCAWAIGTTDVPLR